MINSSNSCIIQRQEHGAVNDIMIWLLYMNMLVQSNYYGDNYHGVWRRMGDCITCCFAEGIHCEEGFDVPYSLRESRRRIYAAAYRSDKTLATFFGRPQMMACRYSNRKLTLDLDDEVIVTEDPAILDTALALLDSEGWNTDGTIWPTSWIRLRFTMGVFRERVLELSLAGKTDVDLTEKLRSISNDCRDAWEALPN